MHVLILCLLLYGFKMAVCFHDIHMEYIFVNVRMNWTEARRYCREHYTDLATFTSMEDVNRVSTPTGYNDYAWIGLFDDPASWRKVMGNDSNSWRWSATGATSPGGYQIWSPNEPNNIGGNQGCGQIKDGVWTDTRCFLTKPFVCFTGSPHLGPKQFTLVSTAKTWEQARSHCRQHYTDLAMIENESENNAVASLNPSAHVWIGLYREPWSWSDGRHSKFTNWESGQPNNLDRIQHCVVLKGNYKWWDAECSALNHVICEKAREKKKVHMIKIKLQADVDFSDSAVSTIEQIQAQLLNMGLADIKLRWKVPPNKQRRRHRERNICI